MTVMYLYFVILEEIHLYRTFQCYNSSPIHPEEASDNSGQNIRIHSTMALFEFGKSDYDRTLFM